MAGYVASVAYAAATRAALRALEAGLMPDVATRAAVRYLQGQRLKTMDKNTTEEEEASLSAFVDWTRSQPVALSTSEANQQHYEVPTEFYQLVLGKHLKYSCCYFENPSVSLDEAEEAMLNLYCQRAQLEDGQEVLELGCGWGSLALYMAARFPASRITAVSNSATQRQHILARCRERGLTNLTIITADMNTFDISERQFDRIVSIEMFEHMTNYEELFRRISGWLRPKTGRLFVHVFAHKTHAYKFENNGPDDWMARHFFTGGTMPSHELLKRYTKHVKCIQDWQLSGTHYQLTSEAWLSRFDSSWPLISPIFAATYGSGQTTKWRSYWRTFFIACAECFGYDKGREWIVSHYLFRRAEQEEEEAKV